VPGASGPGLSCLLCLSLCQAPWSASPVIAFASAALTVRPCPGGTWAAGLQFPVLASHSPKASSDAIKGENLPLMTCCLLKSQEWESKLERESSICIHVKQKRTDPTTSSLHEVARLMAHGRNQGRTAPRFVVSLSTRSI